MINVFKREWGELRNPGERFDRVPLLPVGERGSDGEVGSGEIIGIGFWIWVCHANQYSMCNPTVPVIRNCDCLRN